MAIVLISAEVEALRANSGSSSRQNSRESRDGSRGKEQSERINLPSLRPSAEYSSPPKSSYQSPKI